MSDAHDMDDCDHGIERWTCHDCHEAEDIKLRSRVTALTADLERVTRASKYNCDVAEQAMADLLAARATLAEADRLLEEMPTFERVFESERLEGVRAEADPGFDMCNHCGNEVESDWCPADGDCWGARVRLFLARRKTKP